MALRITSGELRVLHEFPPGSAEAREVLARYRAAQCEFRYVSRASHRERCTERATTEKDGMRLCAFHAAGKKRTEPVLYGEGW